MSDGDLGVLEATSFAIGGVIGGGIFAVLGVVAALAGPTTWLAYLLAGVVAVCAGYSYVSLNGLLDRPGGSVAFLERFVDNPTVAGMVGWTLLVGYIGTMAMYGYAFGAYFGAIFGVERLPLVGLPARPVLSAAVVLAFLGVNLVGVRETGLVEDLLVAAKLLVVAAFGVVGIWVAAERGVLDFGLGQAASHPAGPLVAAGISFVSFEGWQLLFYDQERIADPIETTRTAVYVSVVVATLSYVAVAIVTLALVSQESLTSHPDLALALAAEQFLGRVGYVAIGVAAVASTASAINATMFSSAEFARRMATDDLLPDAFEADASAGVSRTSLVAIAGVTTAFTVLGSLQAITEFASFSFIVVFGVVSALALREARHRDFSAVLPAVGLLGTATFLVLFVWHLATARFGTLVLVAGIAAVVLAVELVYFKRERITEGVHSIETRL